MQEVLLTCIVESHRLFMHIASLIKGQQKKAKTLVWAQAFLCLQKDRMYTVHRAHQMRREGSPYVLYYTFQYLPYSHTLTRSERGSYATCHIL